MLDLHFIRHNVDAVREAIRKKRSSVDLDRFLELDEVRRSLQTHISKKRAEQNKASNAIASASEDERAAMIKEVSKLKAALRTLEEELNPVLEEWQVLLMKIPNIPSEKMPVGDSDEENVTIKTWGEKPQFTFTPKTTMCLEESWTYSTPRQQRMYQELALPTSRVILYCCNSHSRCLRSIP